MSSARQAPQHTLERRSALLAQKLQGRMSDLTESLRAANGRIPFHTKMSKSSALDWWAEHRYDDLGKQAMAGLSQPAVVSLDTALAQYAHEKQNAGLPVEGTAPSEPDATIAPIAGPGGFDASTGP